MPGDITATITDEFERYCSVLKSELSYVEDGSFSWDDAVGLLIIQLKNTDSLNKARRESHATQIQLTSEREAAEGARKTEDFFPTLTLNSSFKSWRISIPARVNLRNVEQLGGAAYTALDPWRPDSIQIRRRLLNDDGQGNGNPTLQICYGDDLMPLREQLNVDDYLVIVKRKAEALYDAFGVKSTVDLGSGKNMYLSSKASTDSTSFMLGGLMADYDTVERLSGGTNILLYGVPGSGKSWTIEHEYCHVGSVVERLVFHPDYTNADFIGQILPVVDAEKQVTWKTFCEKINAIIVGNKAKMASAEDKRLGVYFVHENDVTFDQRAVPSEGYTSLLTEYNDLLRAESAGDMPEDKKQRLAIIREALMHNRMFPEKVIKYLWDDAFKFNPEALFDTDNMESLEQVIRTFVYSMGRERFKIFKPTVRASLYPDSQA